MPLWVQYLGKRQLMETLVFLTSKGGHIPLQSSAGSASGQHRAASEARFTQEPADPSPPAPPPSPYCWAQRRRAFCSADGADEALEADLDVRGLTPSYLPACLISLARLMAFQPDSTHPVFKRALCLCVGFWDQPDTRVMRG